MSQEFRARRTINLSVFIAAALVATTAIANYALAQDGSSSASGGSQKVVFTYADTSEPSSLNPLVGYLGTDYVMWSLAYDIPINFATKDFGPDFDHSIVTSVDASSDGMTFTWASAIRNLGILRA